MNKEKYHFIFFAKFQVFDSEKSNGGTLFKGISDFLPDVSWDSTGGIFSLSIFLTFEKSFGLEEAR